MRKPRSVTRANAKLGNEKQGERISMWNDGGYYDPTPFFAIRNMERTEGKNQCHIHATTPSRRAG